MKEMKVKLTFTDDVLGVMPANKELHETYVASNAPDAPSIEEEIAAMGVNEVVEKTMTVFPKLDDGMPFFWDYQLRGFSKMRLECCAVFLVRIAVSAKLTRKSLTD